MWPVGKVVDIKGGEEMISDKIRIDFIENIRVCD
jgi:hypothetical protein